MSSNRELSFSEETISNPQQLLAFGNYYKNCSFYSKLHSIIISTHCEEKRPAIQGLYEYALTSNEWKFLAPYDDAFNEHVRDSCDTHFQFLDETNHLLYVYRQREYDTDALILKYDLQTHEMKFYPLEINIMGDFFSMIFVSQHNKLHIFGDEGNNHINHIIIDIEKMKEISNKQIASNDTFYSLIPSLLFVESTQTILNVGSYDWNKVSSLNVDEREIKEWKHVCRLPFDEYDEPIYNTILFDDIIVLFQYFDGHIWCMDVKNLFESKKWYKSMVEMPNCFPNKLDWNNPLPIKDNKGFVHLIKLRNDENIHFKTKIKNLIPNEIKTDRKNMYEPLVIGYLKNEEQNMNDFIPHYLKQLIFLFYTFH